MSPIEPKYLEAIQRLADGESTKQILVKLNINAGDLQRALAKIRYAYQATNSPHLVAILLRKKIIK